MGSKKVSECERVPPDGGFGWLVVLGTSLIGLVISVPLQALGLIFQDIISELDTTTTVAGWIPAITVAMAQFIAPFNAILIDVYSPRVSAITGGLSVSIGLILCYFANSVQILFITFGVLCGAGLGMVTNASYVILSHYFRKHYGVVTGIAMASYSTGKLVFSPLIQLMLDKYDYRGVLLILGGMNLNILVGAAVFQPAKQHYIVKPVSPKVSKSKKKLKESAINQEKETSFEFGDKTNGRPPVRLTDGHQPEDGPVEKCSEASKALLSKDNSTFKMLIAEQQKALSQTQSYSMETLARSVLNNNELSEKQLTKRPSCCRKGPLKSLNFSQLKQPAFYVLLISGFLGYLGSIYFGVFLPSLALENGLQPMDAAIIMSARSGAEIFGRLTAPWIQSHFNINLLILYIGLSIAQGISIIVLVFTYSLAGMTSVTVITGIIYGSHTGLSMLMIVTCVGIHNLSAALALSQFIQGLMCLPVGPLIGFLRDFVGSFDICFYTIGAMHFVIAAVWMLKPLAMRHSKF